MESSTTKAKFKIRPSPLVSGVRISIEATIAFLLVTFLSLLQPTIVYSDSSASTNSLHHHLSWKHNGTRFDFVFTTNGTIENLLTLESDTGNLLKNSLAKCNRYAACLFQDGKLEENFILSEKSHLASRHKSVYISDKRTANNQQQNDSTIFVITHYCSTHWNPPAHLSFIKRRHLVEWHSPLTCHTSSTNHERPCYLYDPRGNLIDLTPLIRSDGSSYFVNTTEFRSNNNPVKQPSKDLKGFFVNICNEAYDMCGPEVSSCYKDPEHDGLVEAGYNNLTSISYDAERNNTILLTSLGHSKQLCEGHRVKTVIRLVCKKGNSAESNKGLLGPKLAKSDGCTNVIEWETIHACPLTEIKAPVLPECKLKSESLAIDIDVLKIIKNRTYIEVPNIESGNSKMVLGLCRSLPKGLECEGKATSQTSACLLDTTKNSKALKRTANDSQIVGTISKSSLRLADDRLYLEMSTLNKTCSTLVEGRSTLNITKQIGIRLEFLCSDKEQNEPTYLGFNECSYVFEWASPLMCLESMPAFARKSSDNKSNSAAASVTPGTRTSDTLSPKPPTSDDIAKGTANASQKFTFDESVVINNSSSHEKEHYHSEQPGRPSSAATKPIGGEADRSAEDSTRHQIERSRPDANQQSRMNSAHKFFMITLIIMSLVAFLVVILILDGKTRLRIPVSALRRQARQTFHAQPVPYSRVAHDLDL